MSRRLRRLPWALFLLTAASGRAAAHGGSLGAGARESLSVPTWLFLTTGGAAVGASFLLASFVTDRSFIEAVHDWGGRGGAPDAWLLAGTARVVGVVGLLAVVVVGFVGPDEPMANLAVLVVWVGWWAGFAMSAYLVGNAWPLVNPWRTIAGALPSLSLSYPEKLGAWPSVAGLLVLVWLEVVSPVAEDPGLLATVVVAYSVVTVAGAVAFGERTWFERVDPPARVFRYYGRVAPLSAEGEGVRARLPGMALSAPRLVDGPDEVAFVVALLWVTTFDGFVSTPAFQPLVRPVVLAGVPPEIAYLLAMLLGFALFLGAYLLAVRLSRRTSETYLAARVLARRFAPPLLAIAAGYHFAHYLAYFLSLAPALAEAVVSPLTGLGSAGVLVLALPPWFSWIALAAVLVGHFLAIWVAHATAYDLFPGRLQAIRSQYPFIAVMVLYTMTSLWVVGQPEVTPPYL